MDIILDNMDSITQAKYKEFADKVKELLDTYQKRDARRYNLVEAKIAQTSGNWDTQINLISNNSTESVNISQLLAYEYCLASERITQGKVPFESMLDKLFGGVQKFRIGNPVPGMDDECLYGKSYDDETALPVTSKLYRIMMHAGAQHLEYLKNDSFTGAVFIYEKGRIKGIAQDENGNPVDLETDGIDFSDLRVGQSLLTNLRQTIFHEWTHNAEKEFIEPSEESIEYEYQSEDGKLYRNYERISNYVTSENIGSIKEPQYVISTQRDSNGNRKKYFIDENGRLRPLGEVRFGLERKSLAQDKTVCVSSGLTTREVMANGDVRMHNIITEGFVERTAREMIKAIDPQVIDMDEERYPEYVEIASRVIASRDVSIGTDGKGQTYADFIMHSSTLKRDLESRTVSLDTGSKVDGLHYISDYADSVQQGNTRKSRFYRNMPSVASKLNLAKAQIDAVKQFMQKRELTQSEQDALRKILVNGNHDNQTIVDNIVGDYIEILKEETVFFDGIPRKLGYEERITEKSKETQELGKETLEEQNNTKFLDQIEAELIIDERGVNNQKRTNEQSI